MVDEERHMRHEESDMSTDELEGIRLVNGGTHKLLEEWEEENPTGTRVLKKLAKNSRRKRNQDEY